MKTKVAAFLLILVGAIDVSAHDTFLKFESHYMRPQSHVSVSLMNGTIEDSENSVALDRLRDVRIVGPYRNIQKQDADQWQLTEKLGKLGFKTGDTGTYVAGVSIKPRNLEMSEDDFNRYLEHSGVTDVLKVRQKDKPIDRNVVEKYSKHVKAVFQVGKKRSTSYQQKFNYPIEIVPQKNPCSLNVGDTLPVTVYFYGKPVSNQLVYASYVGHHRHNEDGQHEEAVQTRTDAKGNAKIKIEHKGLWYIRLIHMVASEENGIDYESNWATITFEIQ